LLQEPPDELTALQVGAAVASVARAEACQLSTGETCGLRQVTIGNGAVRAEILLDKGASVRQVWHAPSGVRTLAETSDWRERLAEFAAGGCEGRNYSDCYEGGWQDVLPTRAQWDGGAIGDGDGVGEAAVIRWELTRCVCTPAAAHVLCQARLPRSKLEMVKRFAVRRGLATVRVDTTIRNAGSRDLHFSWTQHPAMGGDLLDDNTLLLLPGGRKCLSRSADGRYSDVPDDCGCGAASRHWIRAGPIQADTSEDVFQTFAHVQHCDAALLSGTRGVGVRLRWDRKTFPHAWLWCARRPLIRCVAVEPSSTCLPELAPRPQPPMLHLLPPGKSMRTWVELSTFTAGLPAACDSRPSLFGSGWS
jgi:hypothetical protein